MFSSVFEAATQAYNKGNYEEMVSLARDVIAKDAMNSYAYYLAAIGEKELGRPGESLELLRRAIDLDPLASNARLLLATVLRQLGQEVNSEIQFKLLIKEFPDNETVASNYSFLLNDLKRYEESINILKPFINRNDIGEAITINIGNAYRGLGDLKTACRFYQRAIEMNGKYWAGAKANLAVISLEEGRLDEAERNLIELDRMGLAPKEAYLNLGVISLRRERFTESLHWIGKGEAMGLDSVSAVAIYAFAQAKLGNESEAIKKLKIYVKEQDSDFSLLCTWLSIAQKSCLYNELRAVRKKNFGGHLSR